MLAGLPNKTKYEWHRVYTSMGSGLEKDKSLENMQEILSLSYGDLPSYLKPCLLYLSMFPEDWEVQKDTLVQMWVAEGLVDEEKGENPYELGERYFNELVNRSMIMPADLDGLGRPGACRVHDMILDLLISLSAQENFVTISQSPLLTPQACKIRRLSLQSEDEQQKLQEHEGEDDQQAMLAVDVDMSHVRSLIGCKIHFKKLALSLSMFSVLRVLSLVEYSRKRCHVKDHGSLKHLRFLSLGGELETKLLEEIGKLQLLRTLDLRGASIRVAPASIVQLTNLEHLYLSLWVNLPDKIGNLRSLRQLWGRHDKVSPKTLAELGNLTELRVLVISNLDESGLRTFVQMMPNLGKLRTLTIYFQIYNEMSSLECMSNRWVGPARLQSFDSPLYIPQLPRWFASLSELSYLDISVKRLRQDDFHLLGVLPLLRFLNLQAGFAGDTGERRFVIGANQDFRSLAKFKFEQYEIFTIFAEGGMPKVQSLELHFKLPDFVVQETAVFRDIGLEHLTSLKHVTITLNCNSVRIRVVRMLRP